jgi:hypothetical protein
MAIAINRRWPAMKICDKSGNRAGSNGKLKVVIISGHWLRQLCFDSKRSSALS